jgi:hypothetical protein
MRTLLLAALGGMIGLFASYLFRPTFLGMGPSVAEWFHDGWRGGDARGTITICTIIGALGGILLEGACEVINQRTGRQEAEDGKGDDRGRDGGAPRRPPPPPPKLPPPPLKRQGK